MTGAKKDDSDSSNFRLIVAPVKTGSILIRNGMTASTT